MAFFTQKPKVHVGESAPDFTLPDQRGTPRRLTDLLHNGPVVLYFYPKDETPGCTAQACSFRDQHQVFADAGAQVVGVSADSVASHDAFARNHRLPFVLLSDVDDTVHALYGVEKRLGLLRGRVTFVIDGKGVVRHVSTQAINATAHVKDAVAVLATLGA